MKRGYAFKLWIVLLALLFLLGAWGFVQGVNQSLNDPALPRDGQFTRLPHTEAHA